jgi:hypothetical protein
MINEAAETKTLNSGILECLIRPVHQEKKLGPQKSSSPAYVMSSRWPELSSTGRND